MAAMTGPCASRGGRPGLRGRDQPSRRLAARRLAELPVDHATRAPVVEDELGQRALDLVPYASHGDAENALAALDEIDDLVGAGALVHGSAIAHQGDGGQVLHPSFMKGVDRCADLLEGDTGVEQSLDDLEQQNVAEGVQALRAGPPGPPDGGLHQPGTGPVVQLPVGDAGSSAGDRSAITRVGVELGERVSEEHPLTALGCRGVKAGFVRAQLTCSCRNGGITSNGPRGGGIGRTSPTGNHDKATARGAQRRARRVPLSTMSQSQGEVKIHSTAVVVCGSISGMLRQTSRNGVVMYAIF